MLFNKQLNGETQQKLLQQLSDYTEQILMQNSSNISYQIAYDNVYRLCRNQKQQQIIETLSKSLHKIIPNILKQLNIESNTILVDVAGTLQKISSNIDRIKDVCLYLNLNYCQKDLNIDLRNKLNQILLQQFLKFNQLLDAISNSIAKQHILNKQQDIKKLLQIIHEIDHQYLYFTGNFIKCYTSLMSNYYIEWSKQNFILNNRSDKIINYITLCIQQLIKQNNFLNICWQSKKCIQYKNMIIKQIYKIIVTQYKYQIYQKHKDIIFNNLTYNLLELFKYCKNDDIQLHSNWYNQIIKEKLEILDLSQNYQFINQLCEFYLKIMENLEKTIGKFDIHYRSRFAFQEWVNLSKIQITLRLNQYIKNYCQKAQDNDKDDMKFLQKISIVFRLMKEKNVFEKIYRRNLVNRLLNHLDNFNMERQIKIIHLMEKQCSQDFVKNIKPIIEEFSISKFNSEDSLNVFNINSQFWPYDEKNKSIENNKKLLNLSEKYTTIFKETNKTKQLFLHPIVGVVKLWIKFLKSKWEGEIIVNTCMANILLYFTKTNSAYQLKNFCCETGYKLDQVYQSIKTLISSKILKNQGNQQNYKLALNEEFDIESKQFNLLTLETENNFQVKNLQDLKADRKLMVEAIIVKIMKKLRTTEIPTILHYSAPQIQKRGFNFNAKFVEDTIKRLIDKEFIRDFQDGKLGYIA